MKKVLSSFLSLLILLAFTLPAMAAPSTYKEENFENATPGEGIDKLSGTLFTFINASSFVSSIVSKEDPEQRKYVIDGKKSLFYTNDAGFYHFAITSPESDVCPLEGSTVYAMNFLLKLHEPMGSDVTLTFYARTWIDSDQVNGWPAFDFVTKNGVFTANAPRNNKIFEKVDVKDLGSNVYSISIRFQTTKADNPTYPQWFFAFGANGRVTLSVDNFRLWKDASSIEPSSIHSDFSTQKPPSSSTTKTESSKPNPSSSKNLSSKSNVVSEQSNSIEDSSETESDIGSAITSSEQTASEDNTSASQTEKEKEGPTALEIIVLVIAIVVAVCGAGTLVFLLLKAKKV